jgi:hypothetical protein
MNSGQRQIIAEKIGSTVRILELLELDYSVSAPKHVRKRGNRSPRVINISVGGKQSLRVYNSISGHTWANEPSGKPIREVGSIEDLYNYLREKRFKSPKK